MQSEITVDIPKDRQPSDSEQFDGSRQFSVNNAKCSFHFYFWIQTYITTKNMFRHILPLFPEETAIGFTKKGKPDICFR